MTDVNYMNNENIFLYLAENTPVFNAVTPDAPFVFDKAVPARKGIIQQFNFMYVSNNLVGNMMIKFFKDFPGLW
jgi:hypothetical protein